MSFVKAEADKEALEDIFESVKEGTAVEQDAEDSNPGSPTASSPRSFPAFKPESPKHHPPSPTKKIEHRRTSHTHAFNSPNAPITTDLTAVSALEATEDANEQQNTSASAPAATPTPAAAPAPGPVAASTPISAPVPSVVVPPSADSTASAGSAGTPGKLSFREMLNARKKAQSATPTLTPSPAVTPPPPSTSPVPAFSPPPTVQSALAPSQEGAPVEPTASSARSQSGTATTPRSRPAKTASFREPAAEDEDEEEASPSGSTGSGLTRTGTAIFDVGQVYRDPDADDEEEEEEEEELAEGEPEEDETEPTEEDEDDGKSHEDGEISATQANTLANASATSGAPYQDTSSRISAFLNSTRKSNSYSTGFGSSTNFDNRSL
jgi:hypothetical protein